MAETAGKGLWKRFKHQFYSTDPRIFVASILFTYLVLGLTVLGFNRSPEQAALTMVICCGMDFLLTRVFFGKWVFPLSAMITSFSLSFLLSFGHHSWIIVLPILLAIGSKYVLRLNGKHFFNPALFGVAGSLLISRELITAAPAYQWNGIGAMSAFIVMLGLTFVIPKVNRHWLVISFLATYTLQTALRAFIMRHHLPFETLFFGTLSSPSFFVFTFFMITDPATSPPKKKDQIIVGVSIALVDLIFHIRQSYYTFFFAALTVASVRFVWFHFQNFRASGFTNRFHQGFFGDHYWRQPATFAAIFLISGAAYSEILHPRAIADHPGFRMDRVESTETGLDADRGGDLIGKIDPRVQHIIKWLIAETEGAAVGDYDGDGNLDLFLAQPLKETSKRAMLYHNEGGLKFRETPIPALREISAAPEKFGIITNAVFVDYDNDGDQDLFLTVMHGHSILLKNMLKETGRADFVDVSHETGLDRFVTQSLGATFADFNHDGRLDLFIANVLEENLPDYAASTPLNLFHLPPSEYSGDRRMFNFMHASWNLADNGGKNVMLFQTPDHRFEVQDPALWGGLETRWSLAVGAADLNHDGWPDLYVANDFGPDEFYLNLQGKGFEKVKGTTFGSIGRDTYKGMDVSIADYDRTGWFGIYISNVHHALQAEGSLLWSFAQGPDAFHPEITETATKKGVLNEERFGWGASAADFDNDGWVDLAQANGMVDDTYDKKYDSCPDYWYVNEKVARSPPAYHRYADKWGDIRGYCIFGKERNRLYLNRGPKAQPQFIDVAESVGLTEETNSRAAISADFENLGRRDLLFSHPFAKPTVYRNVSTLPKEQENSWVGLELVGDGVSCNRDAVGTRVELDVKDPFGHPFRLTSEVQSVSGFLGQSDRRLHFGLGPRPLEVRANIFWCGSSTAQIEVLSIDRYQAVRQAK
jgi:Na+-translocating ferredoxin:NAD+ oxidoreductase RnfD subunit